MLKKLCSLIFIVVLAFVFAGNAQAQSPEEIFNKYPAEKLWEQYCNDRKGDVINLQTWYSGKCTGDPTKPESIGFSDIVLLDFYTLLHGEPGLGSSLGQGGVLPVLGSAITALYQNPPASSANYVAYIKSNLEKHSIVKSAYAQGVGYGFQGLMPILPLWSAFRNVVYALFILVFVFYGFMIMFRFKLGGQTVITIQTAIPQIVITLLLITFSYAIGALLIELMYVVIALIISMLVGQGLMDQTLQATWGVGNVSVLEIFVRFVLHAIFGLINNLIIALTSLEGVLLDVVNAIGLVSTVSILFAIIIILAGAYILFKVFVMLLGAMVNVLLQIIFSPFILLMGIIPGNKAFGNWVRSIVANLAVFPAVITMFAFSFIFMGDYTAVDPNIPVVGPLVNQIVNGANNFHSPTEGGNILAFPIIGVSRNAKAVLALVGFGFFIMTPKVADEIKKALKVPPVGFESALGEPLRFGYGASQWATSRLLGRPKAQATPVQPVENRNPPA